MTHKIAVAVVHGIGQQDVHFVDKIKEALEKECQGDCGSDIVIRPVHWAPVLQRVEDVLWERMLTNGPLNFRTTRHLAIDFIADALAYQPTMHDQKAYDGIHGVFAQTLRELAEEAGEKAPLCIIAHSLGTVIASNVIYDLQNPRLIAESAREVMTDTPLERGETLTLLYTLGSPLALWSLRYTDFGKPITVPSPKLNTHYPDLDGEWINFYDRDDVLAFPLKPLNVAYDKAVTEDNEVNAGGMLVNWNPMSHLEYWADKEVVRPIASALVRTWQAINAQGERAAY